MQDWDEPDGGMLVEIFLAVSIAACFALLVTGFWWMVTGN
jgi:hypothetical protein